MKNYPYNTGRTVTINLDNLGNADIWQLFTIVTAGTNNVFEGDEPDALPAADSDAAYEIFLHIAETADDRADGADAGQRNFLLAIKDEYLDIFETNPADDLRKRLGEEAETITRTALSGHEYTAANIDLAEAVAERNACPVSLTADDNARELRATGTAAAIEDFFAYCKEAARAAEEEPAADDDADDDAPENNTDAYDAVWHYLGCPEGELLKEILAEISLDVKQDSTNLFKAGQFEGTARMLAAAIVNDGADGGAGIAAITRAVYDYCGVGW